MYFITFGFPNVPEKKLRVKKFGSFSKLRRKVKVLGCCSTKIINELPNILTTYLTTSTKLYLVLYY